MRIWRRRKRRKFRLTREGRAFLFVTVGVGLAAVNTANNLLYLVLGLLLSLLLVSGVLSDLALWKLSLERLLPGRMFVGTRALVEIALSNDKRWLSSISIDVIDEVDEAEASSAQVSRVEPQSIEEVTYGCLPKKRGRLQFGTIRIVTRYPFGLIEKGYTVFHPDEMIVFPKLLGNIAPPPFDRVQGNATSTHHAGYGIEFSGSVREYREGDETRNIHWRRTASRGELTVRERHRDADAMVTLHIDNGFDHTARDGARRLEQFEAAISETATTAAAYLARGVSVRVVASGSTSPIVQGGAAPDPIWRFLALLQPKSVRNLRTKDRAA